MRYGYLNRCDIPDRAVATDFVATAFLLSYSTIFMRNKKVSRERETFLLFKGFYGGLGAEELVRSFQISLLIYRERKAVSCVGNCHRFFPDRLVADSVHRVGYSPILVKKPEKMLITAQEYHTTTWEMILPLNDDMILHVAPVSAGTPVTHLAKAFIVPKNTLVKINSAIWHLAPLPATAEELTAMIILPECTYANDCTVVELQPENQFEILL